MAKNESLAPEKKTLRRWQAASGLALTAFLGAAGWAMYQERNYERYVENKINEYPLIDPARNFIPQEHFVVNIQPLREELRSMVAAFEAEGGDVSLYLEFLNSGANISINPNKYLYPASLTKVPIALIVFKKIENGEWSLESELVLMQGDANNQSGDPNNLLSDYPVGTHFTIEALLEALLANSDNTAAAIFLRNLEEDERLDLIEELGAEDLFTPEGRYSAKEYSRIFRALYTSSYLKRENSERILRWLDQSIYNEFLSWPVPAEVRFSHKFGVGGGKGINFYSDAGIVYVPDRPYLLSVIVEGEKTVEFKDRTTAFMREVSTAAYNYFSSYAR